MWFQAPVMHLAKPGCLVQTEAMAAGMAGVPAASAIQAAAAALRYSSLACQSVPYLGTESLYGGRSRVGPCMRLAQ